MVLGMDCGGCYLQIAVLRGSGYVGYLCVNVPLRDYGCEMLHSLASCSRFGHQSLKWKGEDRPTKNVGLEVCV